MSFRRLHSPRPRKIAAYVCIATALGLVMLLGAWGAYYDITQDHQSRLHTEVSRLRSHAERSAGHIEYQLREDDDVTKLEQVRDSAWLRDHWTRNVSRQPLRLYAAVVDLQGRILAHNHVYNEGERLSPDFLKLPLMDGLEDVRNTREPALTDGHKAIDVRVPILVAGRPIGAYHSGLNAERLTESLAEETRRKTGWWALVVGGISLVVLFSSLSLYWITRHTTRLESALDSANARRLAEINQIVLGMAHEIRNPLNAIRINLHTIERVFRHEASLPLDEMSLMLGESTREVERMEELVQASLGYGRNTPHVLEDIDVTAEILSVVAFLKHRLEEAGIEVKIDMPDDTAIVRMEGTHLRQVLLNLLENACESIHGPGQIDIRLQRVRGAVDLAIIDSGTGVPAGERERIFQPFYSTKAAGLGLGLALVKKLIEEGGGEIRCEDGPNGRGALFRLILPAREPILQESES